MKGFASDNNSGVHSAILDAILQANQGHALAYGEDPVTAKAVYELKKQFGQNSEVFFVFNGTGANVLSISAACRPYHAVICAETAHIQTDECGAPEHFTGCKLLTVPSSNGKLTVESMKHYLHALGVEHHSQPHLISISQTTEMGTIYTPLEIQSIADFAHQNNMLLHIDGARLSNAAAALGCSLADITVNAGADMLSFGGTKNGLMYGEAIIFFRKALAHDFSYIRKQGMQLASKMRYIAAQFIAYLENEQWRQTALHANSMAHLLASEVGKIPAIQITQKTEANGVFALVPKNIIPRLQEKYFFYTWDETTSEVRWMTSWDTTEQEVMDFVQLIKSAIDKA